MDRAARPAAAGREGGSPKAERAMDTIEIRDIRLNGRHGAYAGEKDQPQPFDLAVRLHADLAQPSSSDALGDTIDYAELHRRIAGVVENQSYDLLERLAAEIVRIAFEDQRVLGVEVTIGKPGRLGGATASVTLRRARSGRYEDLGRT
jgi:dihydroneopterin aldolase